MNRLPGIYLHNGELSSSGLLISTAENEKHRLIMDGIFFDEESDRVEAEIALEIIEKDGIESVVRRNGHFNIALIDKDTGNIDLISDVLATKPWYFYKNGKDIAAAPTPVFFAEKDLKIDLNSQAVFETIVYNFTLSDITLVKQVTRNRPFRHIRVGKDKIEQIGNYKLHSPDEKKLDTREKMAQKIFEIISRNVRNIINNRKLRTTDVQMPLTGGFDSRHILGTLLKNRKRPVNLRHINIQGIDVKPVDIIAEDLGIPLQKKDVNDLDFKKISTDWLTRSGGFINFHQTYLFDLILDKPENEMIGFDGYLMDGLLGIRPLFKPVDNIDDVENIIRKSYGSGKVLRTLFKNYYGHTDSVRKNISERLSMFNGSPLEKGLFQQILTRSVKYTGSIFPVCGDSLINFAPGACHDSIEFALNASWQEGMYNKARYTMLKKYYPEMDSYPSIYGKKFSELNNDNSNPLKKEKIQKVFKSGILRSIALFIPKLTFGLFEPVKEGEHYWLRRVPELRAMMEKFVDNSLIVKDNIIDGKAISKIWKAHKRGAFNAWTMMNLFTVECAYRALVKKQPVEDIVNVFSGSETEVEQ